jgi:hypothetical protein
MSADEKIEVLRTDNERLFSITNQQTTEIERLQQRVAHIEAFLRAFTADKK